MGRDGLAGLVILAGSAVLYWATLSIEGNPLVPVSPAFYPRLVIAVTALLAALLVAQDVLARRKAPARAPRPAARARPNYALVALLFTIFAGYVFLLPPLGFRIATFVFVVVMQLALEPGRGPRRWIVTLAAALAVTLVTYYVFEHYLQVLLPRGRWTEL